MLVSLPRAFVILTVFMFALMTGPTLVAQAVEAATGEALPVTHTTELEAKMFFGFLSTLAYQWLKKSDRFGLITEDSSKAVQVVFGGIVAAATAAGVHFKFDGAAGTLLVTGLTAGAIWAALWETGTQWAFNEWAYRSSVQPRG